MRFVKENVLFMIENISKIKVALFGVGKMGIHHIRAINLQNNAELVAIADPAADHEKLSRVISEDVSIFTSVEELLMAIQPNVVHICTPPQTHATLAKLALKHGASIYVEKPFTLKKSEAENIISLAEEKGLKVCAGHQVLFEDPARKTQEFLKEIGQIVHVESYFSFRTVRRNVSPVDQLIDILPHPVYLLLHFLQAASSNNEKNLIELSAIDVKPSGEVRGIIKAGDVFGVLIVTLRGRPIESYIRVVGTNGSLYADFVRGIVIKLAGPGVSAIPIVLSPYKQAKQLVWKTTKSFVNMAFRKHKSYPGLAELIGAFYSSIFNETPVPLGPTSIIQTVSLCEEVSERLRKAEAESEKQAEIALKDRELKLSPIEAVKEIVLVTGGTGFLGRKVTAELRNHGWPVRVITRRLPYYQDRIPGVEYSIWDLGEEIPTELLDGVFTIVHCAAETYGGKEAHERNTIRATRNIIYAAAGASVKRFIFISSIAVLKPSRKLCSSLDENSPIDLGNNGRGPYVWGKAKAEHIASKIGAENGIDVKIIRLGPLVDFKAFQPPGRLGREIGNFFVAVGSPKNKFSYCEVQTAAEVIRTYISNFDFLPQILNLIEPTPLTRGDLTKLLLENRPDLKVLWIPHFVLKILSPPLLLIQKLIFPQKKPIDIQDAFSTENYKSDLAAMVIKKVRQS